MKNLLIAEQAPVTETPATAEALLLHAGALPALILALLLGCGMMWILLKTLDVLVAFHCRQLHGQQPNPTRHFLPARVHVGISAA